MSNKVHKYSYNVHCLIDTHLHLISTSLDILGLDILGLGILTIRHSGIRHSGNDSSVSPATIKGRVNSSR